MSVKEIAYAAQQVLSAAAGYPLRRAHVYELLASACGCKSYAAFIANNVLISIPAPFKQMAFDEKAVADRALSLGHELTASLAAASTLIELLQERSVGSITLPYLLKVLSGADSSHDEEDSSARRITFEVAQQAYLDWIDPRHLLDDPVFMDGLLAAADRKNGLAHYALGLLYEPEEEEGTGEDYWYNQQLSGEVLSGAAKDWADAYAARIAAADKSATHYRQAAQLGISSAWVDLANRFDDPAIFDREPSTVDADPCQVAELAERMDRRDVAKKWFTAAAEQGDPDAMRRLIEDYDSDDLQRCWSWVYLADLLGYDITAQHAIAINEDGGPYDDDVGGPCYVDITRDGIELAALPPADDLKARELAKTYFDRLGVSDKT